MTVLDRDQLSADYVKRIVENREDYAARHGKLVLLYIYMILRINSRFS